MKRSTLILIYVFTAFMLSVGFGILLYGNTEIKIYKITVFIYSLASFLAIRLLLHWIWESKNWYKLLGIVLLYYILFISFRYVLEEVLVAKIIGYGNYNFDTTALHYIKDNLYFGSIYLLFGLIIFLIDKQIENQRIQSLLLANYRKAELDFLRLQISPHFLFNALNSIYALAYKKSEKTSEAILQLSDLMRYILYDKSQMLPIEDEWNMFLSYIELQKLRLKDDLRLEIKVTGDLNSVKIPPYTLIPFLENAFKHGDFSSPTKTLHIELEVIKTKINFYCKNYISQNKSHQQNGIGIGNLRKRLDIFYPNNYYTLIAETTEDNIYEVTLTINSKP